MATYDDIVSRIGDDLNRSDLATQIGVALNRAIAHYQSERTWFNETTDTFTTTSGQESYTTADGLATDILLIDTVQITDSSSNQFVLLPRTWDYIRSLQTKPATYTGLPSEWAWYQAKLWLVDGPGRYTWSTPGMVSDVQMWLNMPAVNNGWLLLGNETTSITAKRFGTRENPDPNARPLLVVTYMLLPH